MPHQLRIGLVGCGRWGRHILRDLLTLGSEVLVVTPSMTRTDELMASGASTVLGSVDELPAVDGVVVVTPTSTHAEVIGKVSAFGVPIFVEKPMTCDPDDARAFAEHRQLFVMDKWRYHPGVEMLASIARARELGDVLGLRTTRVQWGHNYTDVDPIWILAPHDISIALEILGEIPVPRAAVVEGPRDAPTGLLGILGDAVPFVFDVSSRRPEPRRRIELACVDGVAVLAGGWENAIEITRNDGTTERRPVSDELPLLRELHAFLDHLRGGPPPRSSASEGAEVVLTLARLRALAGIAEGNP